MSCLQYFAKETVVFRYDETELQKQIDTLHEYNEIKDVGQMLFGKLGKDRDK